MVQNLQFTSSIPERGIDTFEGYYSISNGKVHVFIPSRLGVRYSISLLSCIEQNRKIHCRFHNCRLISVGADFDEYIAEAAFIGEAPKNEEEGFKAVRFLVPKDILPFFQPPWEMTKSASELGSTMLRFRPQEERYKTILVDDNTAFTCKLGYTQSYSNIRYNLKSSVLFELEYKVLADRSAIFQQIEAVADFYSLFCHRPLGIERIQFVSKEEFLIGYYGDRLSLKEGEEYFGNNLVEETQVPDYLHHLPGWIMQYPKNKIVLHLLRDASKLSDEQLRFICYTRCLEVFHKENFMSASKPGSSYFEELHAFVIREGISDKTIDEFKTGKITLLHRLLDLIRSVFELIKDDRLLFGTFTMLNRAEEIVAKRNYLTHFSESKKRHAKDLEQLGYLNFQLALFIRILLLNQFSFNKKFIRSIIGAEKRRMF
ncbi:MAG TPA: HEPN domain-containing protein [Flavisolibacter sp.]|jgi:hypothetical protein|nr:HEPN domain-containing protein [Flavisolibacter sp.]